MKNFAWLPAAAVIAFCGNAVADDTLNLCLLPEYDPGSHVSIPADDAIHVNPDGSYTYNYEQWYWNALLTGADGHNYGLETIVFQFSFGASVTTVVQIAMVDTTTGEYSNQLVWGDGSGYPYVADGFDIAVADGSGAFTALGGAGCDQLTFQFSDGTTAEIDLNGIKNPTPAWFDGHASLVDPVTGTDHGDQYYYNRRDMSASGTIQRPGQSAVIIGGTGWYDREFGSVIGTPGTPADNVHWKWFSLHLSDGTDYMLWDTYANDTGNQVLHVVNEVGPVPLCGELRFTNFTVTATGTTVTSAGPPVTTLELGEEISIPAESLDITVTPTTNNQIVLTGGLFAPFLESTATVAGTKYGLPITGTAYFEEMTSCCQSP